MLSADKIYGVYDKVLHRAPSRAELAYWERAREGEVYAELAGSDELGVAIAEAFWRQFRCRAELEEICACRDLIAGGLALEDAVRKCGERQMELVRIELA